MSLRAVDTNVLVYCEIVTSPHHRRARTLVTELAEGTASWAIPWQCIYEFLRIVTHPRVYHPPVPMAVARADIAALLRSPSLLLLSETPRHQEVLDAILDESGATGNLIHDAHIAALCREHGVTELLTADRDFARFPGLTATNPFA